MRVIMNLLVGLDRVAALLIRPTLFLLFLEIADMFYHIEGFNLSYAYH